MNSIEAEAAKAKVKEMMSRGWVDICAIDQILKMTGGVPPRREYEILRTLHCVNFKDMSPRLRLELPRLLQLVLESQPICYELQTEIADSPAVLRLSSGV